MLGVDHVHHKAKENISNTVSSIELIIDARISRLNFLLYSVFRICSATIFILWQSYKGITAHKLIKWAVPISLAIAIEYRAPPLIISNITVMKTNNHF